ncbi:guanine-N(7)--methyltransferase-like protein [Gonapodya prolifera JEL478]|uniref:tRNA (guanine-N(7)-)-methyltransferase n=1 Tax=Gonapodya prolifera (strain JEL478) TaxID=1344416 RepID=A0A139A4A4_GONPJ|nr:guanine-N(7)--methyltransferase-like protein [Gonapodya prolifera JEL478]|eukprot:KXS11632.1 guanine-N(7)--methyltransferase-like protein [Gonapodya prolifera JEL478]
MAPKRPLPSAAPYTTSAPIGDQSSTKLPQKRYYRQRAHANVFADNTYDYPLRPDLMDWSSYYPAYFEKTASSANEAGESLAGTGTDQDTKMGNGEQSTNSDHQEPSAGEFADRNMKVEIADVGCGYGGLMISLAPLFPNSLILGLEIRGKVQTYVAERIRALRNQAAAGGNKQGYQNVAVMRFNAMKFSPRIFAHAQLSKMFFLFPDPHFKRRKHRSRIISPTLLAEYAYFLRIGGLLYHATDVKELHEWMVAKCDAHPLFEKVSDEEMAADPCVNLVLTTTEEGKKVERNGGEKWVAVWRRIADEELGV